MTAVRVRVPATSANLGPGFDSLGLALALFDDVELELAGSGVEVEVTGVGAESVRRDEGHLVAAAALRWFAARDIEPPGLRLRCHNRIPHSRGLGSSAAAITAGVLGAAALAGSGRDDVLDLAVRIEGHPDNVAACLLGGLTIAWYDGQTAHAVARRPSPLVEATVFIPPYQLSTEKVRGLLPATVPHGDATFNAGRTALLIHALTEDPELLLAATADRLHQDYRRSAMPESLRLVDELRASGVAATVSGAGPTVLALGIEHVNEGCTPAGWERLELRIAPAGASVDTVPG